MPRASPPPGSFAKPLGNTTHCHRFHSQTLHCHEARSIDTSFTTAGFTSTEFTDGSLTSTGLAENSLTSPWAKAPQQQAPLRESRHPQASKGTSFPNTGSPASSLTVAGFTGRLSTVHSPRLPRHGALPTGVARGGGAPWPGEAPAPPGTGPAGSKWQPPVPLCRAPSAPGARVLLCTCCPARAQLAPAGACTAERPWLSPCTLRVYSPLLAGLCPAPPQLQVQGRGGAYTRGRVGCSSTPQVRQ